MTDKLAATDHAAGKTPIETDQTRAAEALAEQTKEDEPKVDIDLPDQESAIYITLDPALRLAPLYAALAKAQAGFPEIPKNRTATVRPQVGAKWSFKYSDLSDLINATRPPLTANGLAVFQVPSDDLKTCITTLAHSTGLVLVGNYPIRHKDGRMHPGQDWAISWAFARRYAMSGLLGIASEETVEGDNSDQTTDDFKGGAEGTGLLTVRGVVVPPGASKADKAKLFVAEIENQLNVPDNEAGLEAAWSRNSAVINTFQDHYPDYHQTLLDVYQRCLNSIREG